MNINKMASILIFLILLLNNIYANANKSDKRVPVIYCTDLFHPHDDPDDHFDIACLYAIQEIDIKAVILDQGQKQTKKPGSIPVSQLNYIAGRNIPYAIGLSDRLKTASDKGLWQAKEYQYGVELILSILKESKEPVTIISVGSLRDIAAGCNRSPDLFKSKVDRLFIFIGEASKKGHIEYNVGLDKNAYIRIMNSGLPVYWIPCFDGGSWQNNGRASYWRASHKDLLEHASDKVMNYFIYALLKKNEKDPVQYLDKQINGGDRNKVLLMNRNLWCSAIFPYIAGRRFIRKESEFISIPVNDSYNKEQEIRPFKFDEVSVFVDKQANVLYEDTKRAGKIMQFHVLKADIYAEVMTSVTAQLLHQLSRKEVGKVNK
ncbi:MAG: hypothetical protein GWN67_14185 [Phycisphaerae bacterium]|nr:hypothetical protein [Phycisphaerae bacterium]NIP55066.1 hypothetical protein [Phycisphaerae bacterium]NIS53777.1 hypothetical protein [Phycisphaerae bacterium]NIU11355.1 hypothetical protein [Phycisphaerae bacterium]NIU57485.1 hypothetical protein [Phycisphaerae bacterium]